VVPNGACWHGPAAGRPTARPRPPMRPSRCSTLRTAQADHWPRGGGLNALCRQFRRHNHALRFSQETHEVRMEGGGSCGLHWARARASVVVSRFNDRPLPPPGLFTMQHKRLAKECQLCLVLHFPKASWPAGNRATSCQPYPTPGQAGRADHGRVWPSLLVWRVHRAVSRSV
jgi:hypothetical protein